MVSAVSRTCIRLLKSLTVRQLASVRAERHGRAARGDRSSKCRHSSRRSDCIVTGEQVSIGGGVPSSRTIACNVGCGQLLCATERRRKRSCAVSSVLSRKVVSPRVHRHRERCILYEVER
jgi:hypothetical protein